MQRDWRWLTKPLGPHSSRDEHERRQCHPDDAIPTPAVAVVSMRQVTDATDPSYLRRSPAEVVRVSAPGRSSGWLRGGRSERPAPGFHRPRLSIAGIDPYFSPSAPIVLCGW